MYTKSLNTRPRVTLIETFPLCTAVLRCSKLLLALEVSQSIIMVITSCKFLATVFPANIAGR